MKKLIAIAVVFALAAGGVFAADLGVNIIGSVNLFQGNNAAGSEITGGLDMNRLRIEGSGENDDGTFGAWIRAHQEAWEGRPAFFGLAWWKPIDAFKLSIGGNPDGLYDKQGYSGWMFHQIVADTNVVSASQAWGCDYTIGGPSWGRADWVDSVYDPGITVFQNAFYGGFGDNGLFLEIKPVDMFGLNILLPYDMEHLKLATVFKNMVIQADINLDFGNIAITYDMSTWQKGIEEKIGGRFFFYLGLSSIENLSLDAGIGFGLPRDNGVYKEIDHLSIGVAAKYSINDAFALKARVLAEFMGGVKGGGNKDPDPFGLIFDIQPQYSINDSVTIFADIGINMVGADKNYNGDKVADAGFGWHFNPYVGIGQEWGPRFFAGFKMWSSPAWINATSGDVPYVKADTIIEWAVPIGLVVSF